MTFNLLGGLPLSCANIRGGGPGSGSCPANVLSVDLLNQRRLGLNPLGSRYSFLGRKNPRISYPNIKRNPH